MVSLPPASCLAISGQTTMQNINIAEDQTVYYNTKANDRTAIFRETQVKYRQTCSSFKDNLNCRMHTANPAEKS